LFDASKIPVTNFVDGRNAFICAINAQKIYKTKFKPNTRYTVKFESRRNLGNSSARFDVYYTDGTIETSITGSASSLWSFTEFTTQIGKTVDYISFKTASNLGTNDAFVNLDNVQINEGSTALPYEKGSFSEVKITCQDSSKFDLAKLPNGVSNTITFGM
jgi:hypothetical protein